MMHKFSSYIKAFFCLFCILLYQYNSAQEHPSLILTKKGVAEIRANLGKFPLFDESVSNAKAQVDAEILNGIEVPIPKDYSGGYTHERHKKNFMMMQKAGLLYQILNQDKYAEYVKNMLFQYEKMYPTLPLHPQTRSYARGKFFWQALNDANWLVYTSQAYDCIYDYLSPVERKRLETNLFCPLADFISLENPKFFNRIHNHSTWANVAVGMIGLAMNNNKLIDRALYGMKNDGIKPGEKDNDGGLLKKPGQKAGFFANIEEPFSPDGYFTEGPYYQRYAMYPYIVFAEALQNKKPKLKVFDYKNGVLLKSLNTLLNLTDSDGKFFPLNDGQKGMSYYSRELVFSLDAAYLFGGKDSGLLSIAQKQGEVTLDDAGFAVAKAIHEGLATPLEKISVEYSDGPKGDQGGVGILRSKGSKEDLTLVMKYTAQGSSHGHYDKLSFSFYEGGNEVLQDYGLSRFVNIQQKGGGNYLKENKTWAKQSIAHNTITQNETSHFSGDYETGDQFHSEKYVFDASNPKLQVVSAKETNAYPGTELQRVLALIKEGSFENPFLLDIIKIKSKTNNQYDLPYYYFGQIVSTNFKYMSPQTLSPLGTKNGYQHLWKEGEGSQVDDNIKISWFNKDRFYSMTSVISNNDKLIFARIGANDPDFNLRNDPAIIIRKQDTKDTYFVSAIEIHGNYDPVTEIGTNTYSTIKKLDIIYQDENYASVRIENKDGESSNFIFAFNDADKYSQHQIKINEKDYKWTGPFTIINN
ncbi:alginate lyase family protein [Kaistella flava (ex Peng et al. 2021)]|uniref:Alginate lyase family protein n=1 Tax=Kaistella flava (ex Peng et al. 2021) TaxID=2038776 RepID=A0A7M2YAM3_9FLAO|nr:heparinase II/III family protein [Kaistella flava (ex Peng et al. 2021)]QOW10403.1 alginate lyase family protein [Kaistella flava (ex Peng et al. 2021)]